MDKIINILLALIVGALCVWFVAMGMMFMSFKFKAPKVEAYRTGLNPVVRLVHRDRTFCSGVVIDENTIVTAGHCLAIPTPIGLMLDPEPIEIRAQDNRPRGISGKPKEVLMQLDRGVLKGDFSMFAPKKYISDVAESIKTRIQGTKYISCGYPLGGDLFCTFVTYLRDTGFCLAVKGVLIPGMSGGPTMLEDGTVVAINDAVDEDFSIVCPIYNVEMEK